jgi:riboflavin transporter FmnP
MTAAKVSASSSKTLVYIVVGLWVGVLVGAVVVGILVYTGVIPLLGDASASGPASQTAPMESGTM